MKSDPPESGLKNCEQELAVAMPSKQPLIAIAKRSPIFEVRQLKCALRWTTRVLWSYGQEQYVNGFNVRSANEAQSWIDRELAGWLQKQGGGIARHLTNGIGVILQSKKRFVFEPGRM